jgi:hypothetical protein
MSNKLTAKQEAFCQALVETGSASEAYRIAYDAKDMKPATVNREAKALTDNPKITTRLAELQRGHAERHEITIDSLVGELEEARLAAMQNPRGISAAVSAVMGKAKLLGLVTEKHEHTGRDGAPIEMTTVNREMSPQEAAEAYARMIRPDA